MAAPEKDLRIPAPTRDVIQAMLRGGKKKPKPTATGD